MSIKDTAARVAVLSTLKKMIDAELKAENAQLEASMLAAKKDTGMTKVTISLDEDTEIGSASLVQPKSAAKVTDPDKFLKWVLSNYADEVERRFVTEVRAAFTDKVIKAMTAAGVTQWTDEATGEIHDVPGVEIRERTAYMRVTVPDAGEAHIGDWWRSVRDAGMGQITDGGAA